jgi:hypothetical protein
MSKYALIQNIGGLTVLVYCVIYFTLELVDFQAISLNPAYIYCLSSKITHYQ